MALHNEADVVVSDVVVVRLALEVTVITSIAVGVVVQVQAIAVTGRLMISASERDWKREAHRDRETDMQTVRQRREEERSRQRRET